MVSKKDKHGYSKVAGSNSKKREKVVDAHRGSINEGGPGGSGLVLVAYPI